MEQKLYCKIEKGKIVDTKLARKRPKGWKEYIANKPKYDPEAEKLTHQSLQILNFHVIEHFEVIRWKQG